MKLEEIKLLLEKYRDNENDEIDFHDDSCFKNGFEECLELMLPLIDEMITCVDHYGGSFPRHTKAFQDLIEKLRGQK